MVSCDFSSPASFFWSFSTACGSSALIPPIPADFIKQALYVPVFLHIPVSGGVLLFFLPCGEVGTSGNQDRGNAPRNFIALVHIRRQFPGISVKQTVNLFMVHRVNTFFLPFCDLYGFVNVAAVFCRCAARFVIVKAAHILCVAGGGFVDRIVGGGGLLRFLCCGGFLWGFAAGFLCCVRLFLRGCFGLLRRGGFRRLCYCFGLRLCLSFCLFFWISAKCPSMASISFAAVLLMISRELFSSASSRPLLHPAT